MEQILDVSRLDASRMKLDLNEVDLVSLTSKLIAGFASRRAHKFRLRLPDHVEAAVDPARIRQVMANLVDNAVRYSPDGGPIDIGVEPEDDEWIVLSVRDWDSASPRSTELTFLIASIRRTG